MVNSMTKLFEGKNTLEDDLKKPVEECEDPECRDHVVIRVSQIKEQLEVVKEEVNNVEVVIAMLNGLTGSGIHSCEECVPEGINYFQQNLGRRRNSIHKKRREDGSN